MGRSSQVKALVWKNWLLLNRPYIKPIFGMCSVCLIIFASLYIRNHSSKTTIPAKIYASQDLDALIAREIFIPYTPLTPATQEIMNKASEYCRSKAVIACSSQGFPTVEEAFRSSLAHVKVVEGNVLRVDTPVVQFEMLSNDSDVPKNLQFKILIHESIITEKPFGHSWIYSGTNHLQVLLLVTTCFITHWSAEDNFYFELKTVHMPTPATTEDAIQGLRENLPLVTILILVVSGTIICKLVGEEKKYKLKESIKLMGVTSGMYWITWMLTGIIYFQYLVLCLMAGLFCPTKNGRILDKTQPVLFYMFLTLSSVNILSLVFILTIFFKTDSITSMVFSVGSIVIHHFGYRLEEQLEDKSLIFAFRSLIPTTAYSASYISFINGEKTGNGYTFTNLHQTPGINYEETLLEAFIALIINTIIYFLSLWYMDNVFPGEYGVPRPYNFCFTKHYWFPGKEEAVEIPQVSQNENYFESPPQGLQAGIQLRNLVKVFGTKVAVAGTNFDIFENQITVLLGHNGAGKTTTMAMITGFLQPTKGTVMVNGHDVCKNPTAARASLGLCPQHDVLFELLTCVEHITFSCWLRGVTTTSTEIETLLSDVGLDEKKTTYAKHLSGGQRRKLSVACAVTGGSKVLVLDEPSSGLDPGARQELWNFLRKLKENRTILMTTHYMDEADALADRIAIMHEGFLKCCGSPLFLKNVYRTGYTLNIVKTMDFEKETLTTLIKECIHQAEFKGSTNTEVYFRLPEISLPKFAILFKMLEDQKVRRYIDSFGVTATSMEEVFIKVGLGYDVNLNALESNIVESTTEVKEADLSGDEENNEESLALKGSPLDANQNAPLEKERKKDFGFTENYTPNSGGRRLRQQMKAIFHKKIILTKRKWLLTLISFIVIPSVLVYLALKADTARLSTKLQPALTYSLKPFKKGTTVTFYDTDNQTIVNFYRNQVHSPHEFKLVPQTKYSNLDNYLVEVGTEMGEDAYLHKMIVGAEIQVFKNILGAIQVTGKAYYQSNTRHGIGISTQMILNTFVKLKLGDNYSVETGIDSAQRESKSSVKYSESDMFLLPYVVVLGMVPLSTVCVYNLIMERQIGAYHLQRMCGLYSLTYWLPTFLWDLILYSATVISILLVSLSSPKILLSDGNWVITLLVLAIYGPAMLSNWYLLQKLFSTPAGGISFVVFYIFVGLHTGLVGGSLAPMKIEKSERFKSFIICYALVNPSFSLMVILIRFVSVSKNQPGDSRAFWEDTTMKMTGIIMCSVTLLYIFLLLLSESMIIRKIWYLLGARQEYDDIGNCLQITEPEHTEREDSDVAKENSRIRNSPLKELIKTNVIVLRNLCKVMGGIVAVDRTCVGIPQGECFGLLGQNGAGKTTTFKMLTGAISATGGDAFLLGHSIRGDLKQMHLHMGYCPQFHSLHGELTGREILYLYGRLKGVPEDHLPEQIDSLHKILNITEYADVLTRKYSGGTMRKLSVAVSLLGKPDFIYLDEPTCGMDLISRRQLWNVFYRIRNSGRTLILTSHSMEECEALCTMIVIMVAGRYRCLGSLQHLKNKFARGFFVTMKLKVGDGAKPVDVDALIRHTQRILEEVEAVDVEQNYIRFHIPIADLKLSYIFQAMEEIKILFDLDGYSVVQTSLQQVFLALSRSSVPQAYTKPILCL